MANVTAGSYVEGEQKEKKFPWGILAAFAAGLLTAAYTAYETGHLELYWGHYLTGEGFDGTPIPKLGESEVDFAQREQAWFEMREQKGYIEGRYGVKVAD